MENIRRLFLSALFMLLCGVMSAQTEISGTVSDSSGETIIGATVMQKVPLMVQLPTSTVTSP